ncbi:MAG TPA: DedA family protein [Stellaceae bacterium]|nr:DedA family protein [Stellaceae bacterium]
MLETLIGLLASWIIATISAIGYLGIAMLMAIESACIPLPSEIIMPFSGYLVSTGRFDLFLVATAGAIGCNIGSSIAYAVGYLGGRPLVERWGRYILVSRRDLDTVDRFFARFGGITVFICRLLPVVRTFIALPAGVARMPQLKFQLYTFIGSWPWCFALAYIGEQLGARWNTDPALRDLFHRFDAVIVAVFVAVVVWYVARHWKHRLRAGE